MVTLKPYQRKAVDNIKDFLSNGYTSKDRILLKAPTGAGKTVITSCLLEEIYLENRDICFIWISIGKSGIHEQSKDKCEIFTNSINTYLPDDIMDTNITSLMPGDALFMNWESISKKNRDKQWTNVFMRKGEYTNFPTLITNTKANNTKIMLIIDEAHASMSSRAEELISIINPNVHLGVTATPKDKQVKQCGKYYVEVNPADVISEGVIKKGIMVNKDLPTDGNIIISLLKACISRREYLTKLYKTKNSPVNPLCLIQVPNGVDGDNLAKEIEAILSKLDISISNNKLAIWTTEDKINLDVLKEINAPQQYLIFKQAIDTGWDCPRAQILLKLRDIKSETFKEQLLGRLLRMPELKHYDIDLLNYAYVYTNEEFFTVDKPENLPEGLDIPTEIIQMKPDFAQKCIYTVLPTFPAIKIYSKVQTKDYLMSASAYLNSKLDIFRGLYEDNSTGYEVKIPRDLKVSTISYEILSSDTSTAKLTPGVIKAILMKQLKTALQDNDGAHMIFSSIMNSKPSDISLYDYLNVILFNINEITLKLLELRKASTLYSQVNLDNISVMYNSLPTEINVYETPIENPKFIKDIYQYFPRKSLYSIEQSIVDVLEASKNVEWWTYTKTFNNPIIIPDIQEDVVNYYSPLFVVKTNQDIVLLDYSTDEEDRKRKGRLLEYLLIRANLPNLNFMIVNKHDIATFEI